MGDDAKFFEEFSKFGEVLSATVSMGTKKRKPSKKSSSPKEEKATVSEEKSETEAEPSDSAEPSADGKETAENKDATETVEEGETKKEEETSADLSETKKESDEKPEIGSLGFGFVSFLEHESAMQAVEQLHGKEMETTLDGEVIKQELYVTRAQKKNERDRELRAKYEAQKMDRISKFQGVNLYVKNIDDSVTDDMLRDEFAAMGTITSARVMLDLKTARPRGFGFVCYSTPEEATRAVNEMNGKPIANKPIFVALAQRREVRRAQLEAQHNQRAGQPGQPMIRSSPMGYPSGMPMYMQRHGGSMQPAYPMMPQMMGAPGRGVGHPMMQQGGRANYTMPAYGNMPQQAGRGARITNGRGYVRGRGQGQAQQVRGSGGTGRGG